MKWVEVSEDGVVTQLPGFKRSMDEVKVVDAKSGGEKGQKLARFSLIPREFLWSLAEHYGIGARKYADRNWERGYKWSLSQDAFERHFNAWVLGERDDPETGSHHLIAAIWHLIALYTYQLRGLGEDDITQQAKEKPTEGVGLIGEINLSDM